MGGLLAAEAAVEYPKHKPRKDGQQIVAVVALDAPLLGMHPHVVVSGIASLFPKKKKKKKNEDEDDGSEAKLHGNPQDMQKDGENVGREEDMNDAARVRLVKEGEVTKTLTPDGRTAMAKREQRDSEDPEWERFKGSLKGELSSRLSIPLILDCLVPPSPSARSHESPSVNSAASSPPLSPLPNTTAKKSFFEKSANFVQRVSNDPLVKFLRKHNDDPLGAAKKQQVRYINLLQ